MSKIIFTILGLFFSVSAGAAQVEGVILPVKCNGGYPALRRANNQIVCLRGKTRDLEQGILPGQFQVLGGHYRGGLFIFSEFLNDSPEDQH